jgi:hypothetical protein
MCLGCMSNILFRVVVKSSVTNFLRIYECYIPIDSSLYAHLANDQLFFFVTHCNAYNSGRRIYKWEYFQTRSCSISFESAFHAVFENVSIL